MSIKIRKVNINEVEKVAEVFNKYRIFYGQKSDLNLAKEFVSQRIINEESVILCAFNERDEVLAFTQLYPTFSSVSARTSWILNDLFVDEKNRKKGIARLLMQSAKELAVKTKAKSIFLQTSHDNKNAQALYESLAYVRDEEYYSYNLEV